MLAGLLISSCATVLNRSTEPVVIHTARGVRVMAIDRSRYRYEVNRTLYVEADRRREPLRITVSVDSLPQIVTVPSRNSFAYWANIYFNYGLGMLVDRDNPRRYTYPRVLYLDSLHSQPVVRRFPRVTKGSFYWNIGMPYINSVYLRRPEQYGTFTGFFGLETAAEYFYASNHSIRLYAGAISTFPVPFPVPLEHFGPYESASATYIGISNNNVAGRFTLGYGLAVSWLQWEQYLLYTASTSTQINSYLLGPNVRIAYRPGRTMQLELLYQPGLLKLGSRPVFDYQHTLSIGFLWNILVFRSRHGS